MSNTVLIKAQLQETLDALLVAHGKVLVLRQMLLAQKKITSYGSDALWADSTEWKLAIEQLQKGMQARYNALFGQPD